MRGFRERQKDQWRHTLTLYCLQYNSGLSKKDQSRRLDPESLLRKMFDGETAPSQDVLTQKLLNLVAMTGGRDHRVDVN